ncbi:MAG: hypothetical protein ACJ75B_06705 [Flavisolibacter sp.]
MKRFILLFSLLILVHTLQAQITVSKLIGKNSESYKLGYGLFSFFEFPLNSEGNYKSIRLELMDFVYYPGKDGNFFTATYGTGYLSIKLGYKTILSETQTGIYLEPSAGYCRVSTAETNLPEATSGNGFAAALEGGYSLEVGDNGHTICVGLKFETDRAGAAHTLNSLGLRFSYAFHLFKRKED